MVLESNWILFRIPIRNLTSSNIIRNFYWDSYGNFLVTAKITILENTQLNVYLDDVALVADDPAPTLSGSQATADATYKLTVSTTDSTVTSANPVAMLAQVSTELCLLT